MFLLQLISLDGYMNSTENDLQGMRQLSPPTFGSTGETFLSGSRRQGNVSWRLEQMN
jgi:hypothetical protein